MINKYLIYIYQILSATLELKKINISQDIVTKFSELVGDFNPIHVDKVYANAIDKFNKVIDKRNDIGSAELLYRLNLLQYKKQFVTFCLRNHYEICMDSVESRRYQEWKSNQPSRWIDDDEPSCYEDATMRHSKYEDIHLK